MLSPIEWLGIGLLVAGGVLLIAGIFRVKVSGKKISPIVAIPVGIILVAVALWGTGLSAYLETGTVVPSGTADTVCATFDMTPSVTAGNGQLNSAEDRVTVGLYKNTSAHTITEDDNTTWVDTAIQFIATPEPFQGADANDLAILYYEVTNPDQLVDSASSTYYLVTKSGGYRQLVWTGDGTHYVHGTTTMLMTANETLTLTIDTAQTDLSYVQNLYDPQTFAVKFSNGCGWTDMFYIDYICVVTYTTG